jgi:ribonuclease HI
MANERVIIHTDGACSGNPGPGGWGAILTFGDQKKELMGGEPHTTNKRMNIDLWKRLDEALGHHKVHWHWVKGHAGHAMNERADELAREGIVAARAGAIGAMKIK